MARNFALFNALNTASHENLWVTDGTVLGTFELTGINGAPTTSLIPNDLTPFNGEFLFNGNDTSGHAGLWVSNGTSTGTFELTGINGVSTNGLRPQDLTVFNGEALFDGADTAGNFGLWVTDGTVLGTFELTGINGASTNGLFNTSSFGFFSPDFVVLNNEVLFPGQNAAGQTGLWETNGTAPGTFELTGINGANVNGIFTRDIGTSNFGPLFPGFAVLNGELLFAGTDTAGNTSLWVSNGTAAGTSEVTGISAGAPQDITIFNNEALFSAPDAGQQSLWVSNGTAAGTFELTGINGANPNGIFQAGLIGTVFPDFIDYNGEVLFVGVNAAGQAGLWVTNGTVAGTFELTGINGANSSGLFTSFPGAIRPGFAELNGEVLFRGIDTAGQQTLWETNGTVAGTFELTGINGVNTTFGFDPGDITPFIPAASGGPALSGVAASVSFTEAGSAATLSPTAALSDPNSATLVSASVILTSTDITNGTFAPSGQASGDALTFSTAGTSITGSYNSSTETLTLTGADTLAHYSQVLDSIAFNNTNLNPSNYGSDPTRVVQWTVNDGAASSSIGTATETIDIVTLNQPPTLSGVAASVTVEATTTVTLSPSVTIADPDNLTLAGATIAVSGGSGDGLATATGGTAITASYNSTSETLTLSGSDTLAHYQTVLDRVTFDGSNTGQRTLTWTLNDGGGSNNVSTGQTTSVSITPFIAPPTLSGVAANAAWTEEGAVTTLSPSVALSDPSSTTLVGATVAIAAGTYTNDLDVLAANTGGTSISASYNNASETLTFSGTDTLVHYQSVLDSVTFQAGENPTDFSSFPTRSVTWTVNDGNNSSAAQTTTVGVTNINDPPTLSSVATSASFTEEAAAVSLASAVTIADLDDVNLSSATVQIIGGAFASDGDALAATTTGTGIAASYNAATETLTLAGTDTLAHYQSVLDSVTFSAGENPTDLGSNPTRTLTWTLMDPGGTANGGANVSTPVTSTVSIINVNDPPTLSNVAAVDAVTTPAQTIGVSPLLAVSDPDNLTLAGATVAITGGTFAGDGDVLAATTTGTNITASFNSSNETLTLTGSDSLAHYAQVLDSVTFASTNPHPSNGGLDPTRTVTWTANDGSGSNNLSPPAVTTISFASAVPFDLNGDTNSDLVFQNNGTPGIWLMNGPTPIAEVGLSNPGASWHVVTSRDVNGDGKADLIWQNSDGTPGIWLMNGTTPIAEAGLANPGTAWKLIGSGDFNGDGRADLLWQDVSGNLGIWEMNGTTPIAEAGIGNPGPNWKVIGAVDFNADGRDDILLQNTATGNLMIDLMNGTSITSTVSITVGDPSWHAVSVGEFNGQAEIAWQNSNGTPGLWLMNGTAPAAAVGLPNPGAGWEVVSIDHFTPDGQADLLFQNTNGAMGLWEMNGTSIAAMVNLPNPGAGWQSVNGHPFAT